MRPPPWPADPARAPRGGKRRAAPAARRAGLAAGACLCAAGAGATPCGDDIEALSGDASLVERVSDADPASRRRLRELMEAAHILDEAGRDAACRGVVAAVAEMTANPPSETGGRDMAAPESPNTRLARSAAADGWSWRAYDYEARADRARPFSEVAERVSSEMIVGAEARMTTGDGLGSVKGFLTDRLGVSHLIVSYGGFLGVGDREVAVPVGDVGFDPVSGVFFIDSGPAWFEEQPDWDRAEWSDDPSAWIRDE